MKVVRSIFGICALAALSLFLAYKAIGMWASSSCRTYEVETQNSPNSLWAVSRLAIDCRSNDRVELSLHRKDEDPAERQNFFLTVSKNSDSVDVVFKWLDNSRLLIAFPEGAGAFEKPDRFRGTQLEYSAYPNDPEIFRTASSVSILQRQVAFDFRFDVLKFQESVRCNMTISAEDGQYFKRISLRLTAVKYFKRQERSGSEIRTLAEHSDASILVNSDNDYTLPSRFFTAASFGSLAAAKAVSRFANFKPVTVPSGRNAPGRSILWNIEQSEAASVLDKIRSGHFDIRLGFWLGGVEIIYASTGPGNLGAVRDFEKCIAENSVFEDKP